MHNENWLVNKNRIWAMRFFQDNFPDEDGTKYMRVHYASCKTGFIQGITPNVNLNASERMTFKSARELWKSFTYFSNLFINIYYGC